MTFLYILWEFLFEKIKNQFYKKDDSAINGKKSKSEKIE